MLPHPPGWPLAGPPSSPHHTLPFPAPSACPDAGPWETATKKIERDREREGGEMGREGQGAEGVRQRETPASFWATRKILAKFQWCFIQDELVTVLFLKGSLHLYQGGKGLSLPGIRTETPGWPGLQSCPSRMSRPCQWSASGGPRSSREPTHWNQPFQRPDEALLQSHWKCSEREEKEWRSQYSTDVFFLSLGINPWWQSNNTGQNTWGKCMWSRADILSRRGRWRLRREWVRGSSPGHHAQHPGWGGWKTTLSQGLNATAFESSGHHFSSFHTEEAGWLETAARTSGRGQRLSTGQHRPDRRPWLTTESLSSDLPPPASCHH